MAQIVNTDEIRQIQALMVLLLGLKPGGKLHVLFEHVLRNSAPTLERVTPISNVTHEGMREWLESNFAHGNLSVAEQGAIDWQKDPNNMGEAIQELEEVENRVGFKITIQKK